MTIIKKYDTLVFIGRFQPIHNAHVEIIRRATELAKQVIIIVGSAKQPRTYKNPFTAHERTDLLKLVYQVGDKNTSIRLDTNTDTIYNDDAWAIRVQSIVAKYTYAGEKIGIIGHKKDLTSDYLNMFPQWSLEEVESIEPLHATDIRDLFFRRDVNMNFVKHVVPANVFMFLENFRNTREFEQIVKEREFLIECKRPYVSLPYPPIFVTSDAAVMCSAHILLIKRRAEPGKGLWALPGGYVNAQTYITNSGKVVEADKSVEDAMLRELREETLIKVPTPVLRGSIEGQKVFDAVDRSPRGRIITHAFKIMLPAGELPKVKGSDDAEKAKWIPIAEVNSEECFEDHYEIIQWALGK
jgi:bifunctional NMN adenylyltransferase/nudix hydrolase